MRRLLLLIVPLALTACSQREPARTAEAGPEAASGGAPLAGLWTTTTTINGRKAFGENQTCMGADGPEAGAPEGEESAAGCATASRKMRADGYNYELVCEKDGLRSVVSGEVRRAARRTIASSTTRMFGPDGKEAAPAATVVVESTFAGPCPAGMKPGDFVQQGVG